MSCSDEKRRRVIIGLGVFYLVFLLAAVATTSFKYRGLYVSPAIESTLGEDEVVEVWNGKYESPYAEYRRFIVPIWFALGIYLPVWAAVVGISKRSFRLSLAALAVGGAITVMALSLLPTVYFPFDKYPVAMIWTMWSLPWIAGSLIVTAVSVSLLTRRKDAESS